MKKIVAAAFVGLTLAGAAFAEISFSYTGKNYFSQVLVILTMTAGQTVCRFL